MAAKRGKPQHVEVASRAVISHIASSVTGTEWSPSGVSLVETGDRITRCISPAAQGAVCFDPAQIVVSQQGAPQGKCRSATAGRRTAAAASRARAAISARSSSACSAVATRSGRLA